MPDPIRNSFGYGQLWPLWPVCAARIGPDHICLIQLPTSVFCKEDPDHVVQNSSRSDPDDLVRFWANASGLEASQCARIVGPRFWLNTTGPLPVSHFQTCLHSLTDGLEHIVQNCPDPIWFWLTLSCFGQTDPVRKQAGVHESSGPRLSNASQPIRTGWETDPACSDPICMLYSPQPSST